MTYNFDPDLWYQSQLALLEARRQREDLDAEDFRKAVVDLDRRYDELVTRLDGTYEIPSSRSS